MNLGEVVAFYGGYIINCNLYPRGLDRFNTFLNIYNTIYFKERIQINIKIKKSYTFLYLCNMNKQMRFRTNFGYNGSENVFKSMI